ncbi:hypothetical protein N864_16800 [Intrasporangium chromatireducens Q5-1]|uniref:TrbL/VirB6 plasmid conjugal transfer protein n=1 Tax=Intrasporangium chromatireducens Q5-1 TaxID=584657 RepID=W9GL12_9MICO|nr:hypothetical protein [Intrasporangium chromatireducens]EWT06800.1 hypothetical protein N864_16800 [Intrasporangium chromatireducens Q5-1]
MDPISVFTLLAGTASKVVADAWTVAMLGLWNAGLWVMRIVLNLMDAFLTPDLSEAGPAATVYQVTFWAAGALVVAMAAVQLGVAAVRRDGKSLATVLVGVGQFAIVCAGWIVYGVAVVTACGGLTRALMERLLSVSSWSQWQPWGPLKVTDLLDATVATVLGLMGLLLWLAAIGHLLVMLTRAGALLVLVVTTPISAAGLVSEAGRSWFWKSLRWFHAAAFTPVLMVLVLGLGVQLTTGVASGLADGAQSAIGIALPAVILILIGVVSPLALFKLLAFVEPGTHSGAALRNGLSAQGGIQNLLSGRANSASSSTSTAASATDGHGRPHAETAGQASTSARFGQAGTGVLAGAGAVGAAAAAGLAVMQQVGAKGAAVGADITNQGGMGHQSWYPDSDGTAGGGRGAITRRPRPSGADDAGERGEQGMPPPPVLLPTAPTAPGSRSGGDLPAAARQAHGPTGAPGTPATGSGGGGAAATPPIAP